MSVDPLVAAETTTAVAAPVRRRSAWRRLARDPQAVIAGGLLVVIGVLGLLASVLAQHDPNQATLAAVNLPMGSPGYPLGADQSGRDIFARLLASIPTSYIAGLIGTAVALAVGVTFGLIGGYVGGWVQGVTEWFFSLIMTFPGLLVLIILIPVTGGDYKISMAFFGILLAPGVYRIVRNQVVGVKKELYVDAARISGLTSTRILRRHILFVVRSPIIISAAFLSGACIGIQSGLAFLGLGSPLIPSFGAMIGAAFSNLYRDPTQVIWPSLLLGVITACLVLFGNSLRDAFEASRPKPQSKRAARQAQQQRVVNASPATEGVILEVKDLTIAYPSPGGELKEVVKGVDITLRAGETLGLVGESGSGKTQTAFAVLGVLPAEALVVKGSIRLDGRELLGLSEREMRAVRGRLVAYVPQEPMSNLDPSYTVGRQLVEGLRASTGLGAAEAKERILALLERVGIVDPQRVFRSFPHQISGGMAQRVLIAGAVASRPKLLIADEPTTALDVTVQAEILDLLRDLQAEMNMAVLMVTHNFGVVADSCSRIAVMQSGKIVESGPTAEVFASPQHEYTAMLLNAILDETSLRTDPPVLADAKVPS
jgi:peptide/nickel transport system permease protein